MNDMTNALQLAGIKISVPQRVWTWLKDNGPHKVKDVESEMKLGGNRASSACNYMYYRGMLSRTTELDFNNKPSYVYTALGQKYELLPAPGSKKMLGKRKYKAASKIAQPAKMTAEVPVAVPVTFKPGNFVMELRMREMRELYDYLGRLFKNG